MENIQKIYFTKTKLERREGREKISIGKANQIKNTKKMIGVSQNIKYVIVNGVDFSVKDRVCYVELKQECINWLLIRHRLKN